MVTNLNPKQKKNVDEYLSSLTKRNFKVDRGVTVTVYIILLFLSYHIFDKKGTLTVIMVETLMTILFLKIYSNIRKNYRDTMEKIRNNQI